MSEKPLLILRAADGPNCVDSLDGALYLSAATTPEDIDSVKRNDIARSTIVIIDFASSSDGRGFSLARHLRLGLGYQGVVYASGEIIPDQVNMVFDCGCDGVLVSERQCQLYGRENWLHASTLPDQVSYWSSERSGTRSIWSKRTQIASSSSAEL